MISETLALIKHLVEQGSVSVVENEKLMEAVTKLDACTADLKSKQQTGWQLEK